MRFRWSVLAAVLLIPLGAALFPSHGEPPVDAGKSGEVKPVVEAVKALASPDYVVVRDAIEELNGLLDAPNINMAVDPLILILSCRNGFYDSYTRCMAAHCLVRIGVSRGWPQGKPIIEAVVAELEDGNIDVVRAASAKALATIDWEMVYDPLIEANEADPSPLVRRTACEALLLYTSGLYSTPVCHYEEDEAFFSSRAVETTLEKTGDEEVLEGDQNDDDEMLKWAQNHILLPPELLLKTIKSKDQATGEQE